jgi:hypothetical protein
MTLRQLNQQCLGYTIVVIWINNSSDQIFDKKEITHMQQCCCCDMNRQTSSCQQRAKKIKTAHACIFKGQVQIALYIPTEKGSI